MNPVRLLPLIVSVFALGALAQEAPPPSVPGSTPAGAAEAPAPPAASELGTGPAPQLPLKKADPALDLMPAQPGQLAPSPQSETNPLIPDAPPKAEKKKEKKSKTEAAEEELNALIRLREAKTRALATDPTFNEEFRAANTRHTDLEKREALKKYYQRLYGRIRKIDPSTKKLANERERLALRKLTQQNITPTEPLDPAERSVSGILAADPVGVGF